MKVAILGFDVEGRASFEYFNNRGDEITICDMKTDVEVPQGVAKQLGDTYLDNLDRFDVLVRTPGLPPRIILKKNPDVENKITTLINEFFKASPTKNIIGVTGTKGKGTTSTLIYEMLKQAGRDTYIGGNIGLPPLAFLPDLTKDSWVVLELSSFQLIDSHYSPHIAVCLVIVPEHLNWHLTLQEYLRAKSQLFAHQTTDDIAIFNAHYELTEQIAQSGDGVKLPFMVPPGGHIENERIRISDQRVMKTDGVALLGAHNLQNACAAITAVWEAGMHDTQIMRQVLADFTGLEHRLEFVRDLDSVKYYDDSFGTTPETAIVAIQAFKQPKVLILGGSDKGANYDELANAITENNVRHVVLIGEQAARIQAALEAAGYTQFSAGGPTMPDIVATARALAQAGDVVLLSTACASFDMFKNYKDRGNQFKQVVAALS